MAINSNKLRAMISRVRGQVPIGGIIIWSGAIADIPDGWQLCNGTNGTPGLSDRFVRNANGTSLNPGNTGGGLIAASTGLPSGARVVDDNGDGSTTSVASPGHGHTITFSEDEPRYYALAYIMRIS